MPLGLLDRSPEVTGTRIRKQVDRLNVNSPASIETPERRKNEILPGNGVKLGTSPKILAKLQVFFLNLQTCKHVIMFCFICRVLNNLIWFFFIAFCIKDQELLMKLKRISENFQDILFPKVIRSLKAGNTCWKSNIDCLFNC